MSTTITTTLKQNLPLRDFGLRRNQPAPVPASAPHKFDDELWRRLKAMDLDEPGVETPISKRLATEHKWTAAQTLRAIEEYKRFVYLTQRAGFEVTPSRPVDLVWHEHLMHTKHYWDTMCRDVLRNDLHHNPGSGGTADADRLMAQYERTLNSYREAFREDPPADIWPRPVLQQSAWPTVLWPTAFFAGAAVGVYTRTFPLILICAIAFIVAIVAFLGRNKQQQDRGGCGSGCGGGAIGSSGAGDSSSSDGGGDGGGGCGGGGD